MENYLKLAIRNLLRNKEYFVINVFGLAVGMACAIMVLLYIWEQSEYDDFHPSSDRLYRLYIDSKMGGLESTAAVTSPMFAFGLKHYVPEIEQSCRIFRNDRDIPIIAPVSAILDNRTLLYVDSTFFDIFGFKLIIGDPKTCLNKPRSIVLSHWVADQLFPNGAIGKTLTVEDDKKLAASTDSKGGTQEDNKKKWTVTGVIEDCPTNSHINYKSLVSLSSLVLPNQSWTTHYLYTYFRFNEEADMNKRAVSASLNLTAIEEKMSREILEAQVYEDGFFYTENVGGYDIHFTISSQDCISVNDIDYDETAKKSTAGVAQIRRTFIKGMQKVGASRILLNKVTDYISQKSGLVKATIKRKQPLEDSIGATIPSTQA